MNCFLVTFNFNINLVFNNIIVCRTIELFIMGLLILVVVIILIYLNFIQVNIVKSRLSNYSF